VLFGAAASSMIALGLSPAPARAAERSRKRILFFTKSSGYEHSVIKQAGGQPSHAENVLRELAPTRGWEVVHTKDGGSFTKANLATYDAFLFYTTGDLTTVGADGNPAMTPDGKTALLEAIASGKGFVGVHSASDTFHSPGGRFVAAGERADPYVRMLGAEFIQHGKQQKAKMRCADPKFPGCAPAKGGFELLEEWYSFKDFGRNLHVILAQETDGMAKSGADSVYDRPPYPATWARTHGKGRVFYTSMGHREDVWTNPLFQDVLAGGIAWVLGEVQPDVTPNIDTVTPRYRVIPPER
jgi:type 1 glutamine amidotransferase